MEPTTPPQGPEPVRTSHAVNVAWLAIGSLVAVAGLLFGTVQAVGLLAHEERVKTASFDDPAVKVLDVASDAGRIEVVGADIREVRIVARISDGLKATGFTTEVVGNRLQVRVHCNMLLSGPWCRAALRILVPRDLEVQVRSGEGVISVRGLTGRVDASSKNASVEAEGLSGAVHLHSGDGSVRGSQLRSPSLDASADNGSVALEWATPATSAIARSDNGNVVVAVPRGEEGYAVDISSDNGSTENQVRTDSTSERRIVASSTNGDVTVRYLD